MRLAFDTSLLRSLPLEQALQQLSEIGYRSVEVGLAHYFPHEATDEETLRLRAALSNTGIELAALVGIYPVSYPDEELRTKGVEQFRKTIERAKTLGCGTIVSEMMGDSEDFLGASKAFTKSMAELVPLFEAEKVTLCFEAHPGDFTDRNKVAVDLIRGVGSSRLRYLFCLPHSFVLGDDVGEMIEYARDVLGYVHCADTLRPEKTFFSGRYFPKVPPHQHLTPGRGDVDLAKAMKKLKEIGYGGHVTLNPFSMFDTPIEAARESKAVVERLIAAED